MSYKFNKKLQNLVDSIDDGMNSIVNSTARVSSRVIDKHICIGVTGFSGSGKSTFITSLIHQLRFSNEASLSGFLPARDQKIVEVNLLPLPHLELFDYQKNIESLSSSPPKWPNSTSELSGCVVEIIYKRNSYLKSILGEHTKLKIEIRDYPGEWILDIPLLEQDYFSWSIENSNLFQQPERMKILGSFYMKLQSISPFDVLSETEIDGICDNYIQFLKNCKNNGMTLIQPGRMLLSGSSDLFSYFFPVLGLKQYDKSALDKADENCIYKVMNSRFSAYQDDIVKPFYHDFFKSVDRQIILIDTLKALGGSKDNFEDMMIAFSRIIDSYKVGLNGFLDRVTSPKVERIIFLSSKPDGILISQHENLRHLTDDIIKRVCKQSIRNSINIETEIACAVRTTEDMNTHLTATLMDGKRGKVVHPIIPENIPTQTDWDSFKNWQPLEFQPPVIPGLKFGAKLPCIRIDKVLKDLIGDKFND